MTEDQYRGVDQSTRPIAIDSVDMQPHEASLYLGFRSDDGMDLSTNSKLEQSVAVKIDPAQCDRFGVLREKLRRQWDFEVTVSER